MPVLGICYGMQLGCQMLGAEVAPAKSREYGRTNLAILRSRRFVRESAGVDNRVGKSRRPGRKIGRAFCEARFDKNLSVRGGKT